MATLQEKLIEFGLSEDQIKDVNTAVDALIETKISDKDKEIADRDGNITSLTEELNPHREKAQVDKINKIVSGITSEDKLPDAIALAGITEDDDDETIKSKVKKVVDERPHLQNNDDLIETKTVSKQEKENPGVKEEPKGPSMPSGVK